MSLPLPPVPVRIDDGAGQSTIMQLPVPSAVLVGRQSGCDLVLHGDEVSRAHARFVLGASTFMVEDLSQRGVTTDDGLIIRGDRRELRYGSSVRIGRYRMRVGEGVAPPPPPPPRRAPSFSGAVPSKDAADVALRRRMHAALLENLDLAKIDPNKEDPSLRPRVLTALKRIVKELEASLPPDLDRDAFIGELLEEAIGLGPLEPLLADPSITEVMVVDPQTIYVERRGRLERTTTRFTDDERVRAVIERIITPLGRRIDESQPLVDARLKDGSRVNAIIRPLALRGTCITIRKFPARRLGVNDLVTLGSLTPRIARFLERCVAAKKNILISGGTGSGKTTLLNVLSAAIPADERIVTIEDAAELQLHQPHVVTLETKSANMEGKGAFTIRDLVKNALRMRPDRIVVGECRSGEALDMLQAMNTGHDGSLTTLHANSPEEALARLETLVLMAGLDLPSRAIREQMSRCIHVVVQIARLGDGTRKVTCVSEVTGLDRHGRFETRTLFELTRDGTAADGTVIGEHLATGYLPSFVDELLAKGLLAEGEPCL
ncbi:MAG: Flp pilus assembly complex ATPase component TadA [Deltaproteobacteria bacterium]|nr:Flp pilus assembly complex ATPase component TadA [Deltaproteobacteria bacterium]